MERDTLDAACLKPVADMDWVDMVCGRYGLGGYGLWPIWTGWIWSVADITCGRFRHHCLLLYLVTLQSNASVFWTLLIHHMLSKTYVDLVHTAKQLCKAGDLQPRNTS